MTQAAPYETTADPNEADEAREFRLREESGVAYAEGRFGDAFNLMQQAGLDEAIRWFRQEGIAFTKPKGDITPLELIVGLASAARAEVAERGEEATNRLSAATSYLWALAEFRLAMDSSLQRTRVAEAFGLAELVLKAAALGELAGMMHVVRIGWLDKLAELETDRERRRSGAHNTNAAKATAKNAALAEALRVVGRNPTLSNEEIAIKLRSAVAPNTTVKTLTTWVGQWRRRAFLPARKAL